MPPYQPLLFERLGLTPEPEANNPLVHTITRNSPNKVHDFCSSVAPIFARLKYTYLPALVVYPLRGAMPIASVMQAYMEVDPEAQKLHFPIYSPIGLHCLDSNGQSIYPTIQEKEQILARDLQEALQYLEAQNRTMPLKRHKPDNIVLIDEVQTGQSVTETMAMLQRIAPENYDLNLLAFENLTNRKKGLSKYPGYNTLTENVGGVRVDRITGKFFSIDNPHVLDMLIWPHDAPIEKRPFLTKILHNQVARDMFLNLARGVLHPQIFNLALYYPEADLSSEVPEQYLSIAQDIQRWIKNSISSVDRPAMQEQIASWISRFASLSVKRRG
jgi:hypothetical protein